MKIHPGVGVIIALLSIATTVLVSCLIFGSNNTTLQGKVKGVERVDMEMVNRQILLDVYLEYPQSCHTVISALGIGTIVLHEKVYVPTCAEVGDRLIKVTYAETLPS